MSDVDYGQDSSHPRFIEVVQRGQQLFKDMETAVSQERGCHEIFSAFGGIKDIINELGELLLTLRLKRCLLPQFNSYQEIINAATTLNRYFILVILSMTEA